MKVKVFDSSTPFKLGNSYVTIIDLLGQDFYQALKKKFNTIEDIDVVILETVRYLFLSSFSNNSLFFPGDKLMDDIWHALINETRFYRELCHKFKPGSFIDHSGVTYADYCKMVSPERSHEEQFSWLASYIYNFGAIEEKSFEHLLIATGLAKRLNLTLPELNKLGLELASIVLSNPENSDLFNFEEFLEQTRECYNDISEYSSILSEKLQELISGLKSCGSSEQFPFFSNESLFKLFSVSTALAFTIWQHLSASERLDRNEDWKSKNRNLWNSIANGEILLGLATTHLSKSPNSDIIVNKINNDYILNGTINWVTGYGIFSKCILGFETDDEIIYTLIDFPTPSHSQKSIEVIPLQLTVLNGTSTVSLKLTNLKINSDDFINKRRKNEKPSLNHTKFRLSDLGIASGIIFEIEKIINRQTSEKNNFIKKNLEKIKSRLNDLYKYCIDTELTISNEIIFLKDELIRDAARILTIASGGAALHANSPASRYNREIILIDAIVQPPELIQNKIVATCNL